MLATLNYNRWSPSLQSCLRLVNVSPGRKRQAASPSQDDLLQFQKRQPNKPQQLNWLRLPTSAAPHHLWEDIQVLHTTGEQQPKRWRRFSLHLYLLDSVCKIILFCVLISTCHTQTKSYSRSYIPHQHVSISVCICLTSVFIIASCSLPSEMRVSAAAYFTRLHNQCKHFET